GGKNETSDGAPESSPEAIALRHAMHGQSRELEAQFGHLRVRSRGPDPVRRRRRRANSEHFPRDRFERVDGRRENRAGESGGPGPAQAIAPDRPRSEEHTSELQSR